MPRRFRFAVVNLTDYKGQSVIVESRHRTITSARAAESRLPACAFVITGAPARYSTLARDVAESRRVDRRVKR